MPVIKWNDSLIGNIEVIDQQHKQLVDMINAFYDALREKKHTDSLLKLIKELMDYTQYHFTTEENLMIKYDYVFAPTQIAEHKQFVEHVRDWYERVEKGQLVISLEITTYLKTWLVDHISKLDKNFCVFLKGKGVQ